MWCSPIVIFFLPEITLVRGNGIHNSNNIGTETIYKVTEVEDRVDDGVKTWVNNAEVLL